ncbi:MAG: DUF5838 family protein [Bacteroidota bacterium]
MHFKGSNKLNDHIGHFKLPLRGLLRHFYDLAAKDYHSMLEVSVKVQDGQVFPGRVALFYYLEEKDIFIAWKHFRAFVDRIRQEEGIVLHEAIIQKVEATLSQLEGSLQFAVGIDLREHLPDSRIKFGLVGEAMGPAMQLLLTEMEPGRFPPSLLRRIRTGGFDLHMDGRYSLKLYPVFAQHQWRDALEYFNFSESVSGLLSQSEYFYIATHHRNFPVQLQLTREQLFGIIPMAGYPLCNEHNSYVLGLERDTGDLQTLVNYNLYY